MFFAPRDPRAPETRAPRALLAFTAIAAGYGLARFAPQLPAPAYFAIAAAACAAACCLRARPCRIALAAAAVAFGAGWFTLRMLETPPGSLAPRLIDNAPITVEGLVLDTAPRVNEPHDPLRPIPSLPTRRFTLAVDHVHADDGRLPAAGHLRVHAAGEPPRPGDRVRVSGLASPLRAPRNPGEFDARLWGAQDGEAGALRVPDTALIEVLPPHDSLPARAHSAALRARAALRDRTRHLLLDGFAPDSAAPRALLAALILGELEPGLRDVRSAFTRLGLAHVMAISGFHIAVMAAIALLFLRLTGDRGWAEPAIVALLVLLYLVIVPVNAPVWRAALMVLALLAADALGRRYGRIAMLAWIAAALILWRPMDLWSMGFQLSFGLVGLLMWLGAFTHARLWRLPVLGDPSPASRTLAGIALDRARQVVSANVLCCACAMPLVAWHTGLVSWLAILTGVAVLPAIVALMFAAYAAIMLGVIVPPLGAACASVLGTLAGLTVDLVNWMDSIPGTSSRLPSVSLAWAAAATAVALYWFARGHRRDRAAWLMTLAVVAWLGIEVRFGPRLPDSTLLRIDTLAVGDGTCHLLRSGRDAILWDCGSMSPGIGRTLVPRAAFALGAGPVRTAVISHPDLDHFNGLLDAAGPLGIRTVLVAEAFTREADRRPDGPEAFTRAGLESRGISVRTVAAGDAVKLGQIELAFISPPRGRADASTNDLSLVAVARERDPLLLLCGDIEGPAMASILRDHPTLAAPIMEAPHHGSTRNEAVAFVAGVNPRVVLQSTGPGRADDPRWAAIRAARAWHTTALNGAAWAEITRDGSVRSGGFNNARN